jgi:hypothetical protein
VDVDRPFKAAEICMACAHILCLRHQSKQIKALLLIIQCSLEAAVYRTSLPVLINFCLRQE